MPKTFVRVNYKKFACFYDNLFHSKDPRHHFTYQYLLKKRLVHGNILDIGCGTGRMLELLSKHDVQNLSGVDISEDMLEIARKRVPCTHFIEKELHRHFK